MFEIDTKILIIDDRPENLHATKMTLAPLEDVEIHTAQSGNEGLALMLEHEYAVVLLDVQMPGMDGFETAELMHSHDATRNIPIIFVTAISKEKKHVFKGYKSGAVDYLFKPINPDILVSKVKVFVKLYQQRVECERMQQELQKSRNLEALGLLAGGIAHDFNNLMSTVFGYIQLAQRKIAPDSEVHRELNEAVMEVDRVNQLTQQLLTFSHGGRPLKERADIASLLTDTATMLIGEENLKVHCKFADAIDTVEFDKGQIRQVFKNLLINVLEFMPEGGNLILRVENCTIDSDSPEQVIKQGRYVRITFDDDGPGIDSKDITKIFDPYFSTKKIGEEKGQGLGLTIAHSIVKKHGGYIFVESEPGIGTAFKIYLPVATVKDAPGEPAGIVEPVSSDLETTDDRQRILLMEDEQSFARALKEMLEYLGYETDVAVKKSETIDLYTQAQASNKAYDVVMLELTCPGGETAEKVLEVLKEIDPEVKAIVTSGYVDDTVMTNYETYGFVGAINKPFTLNDLSEAVEKVL